EGLGEIKGRAQRVKLLRDPAVDAAELPAHSSFSIGAILMSRRFRPAASNCTSAIDFGPLSVTESTLPSPKSWCLIRSPAASVRSPLSRTDAVTRFAHSVFGRSAIRARAAALASIEYPDDPSAPKAPGRALRARERVPPKEFAEPGDCRHSMSSGGISCR